MVGSTWVGSHARCTADRSGIIDAVVEVDLSPGWHAIGLSAEESAPPVRADVFVVDPETRFGLVSDIDDTVMVTALPRPLLAAWHTFVVNEHARSDHAGDAGAVRAADRAGTRARRSSTCPPGPGTSPRP